MQSNAQHAKPGYHKRFSGVLGVLTRVKDYECGIHDDEKEVKYVKLENDTV